jgi:hypothetical protein
MSTWPCFVFKDMFLIYLGGYKDIQIGLNVTHLDQNMDEPRNKVYLYVFFWLLPRHQIKFCRQNLIWRRGNTQKKTYKFQNTAKIWNQEIKCSFEQ